MASRASKTDTNPPSAGFVTDNNNTTDFTTIREQDETSPHRAAVSRTRSESAKTRSQTVTAADYNNSRPRPKHKGPVRADSVAVEVRDRRRGSFSGTPSSATGGHRKTAPSPVHTQLPMTAMPFERHPSTDSYTRRRRSTLDRMERGRAGSKREKLINMNDLSNNNHQTNMPDVIITNDDEDNFDSADGLDDGKDEPERDTWGSKLQFFLTVIAYAVGLGNVWRLPYLCQQNGGGAFLIPYFVMLVFEGVPLFVLELGIGQKMRVGSISVWNKVHPLLGGLGIASAMVAFLVGIYYIVVCAWCVWYLFSSIPKSFPYTLPWSTCPNDTQFTDHSSLISTHVNGSSALGAPGARAGPECRNINAANYFWWRTTLDITDSIDDFGGINWKIVLCFLFAWAAVFFTMFRGIKSSGKAMYFAATFPYFVLTIFFFRGITLPGAWGGIKHMFTPKMNRLIDPVVWLKAATQIFYSFGLGFGSLISFGSYNQPNANVKRDAVYISAVNVFTGVFATLVVFSVLGYRAQHQYNNCIDQFYTAAIPICPEHFNEFRPEQSGNVQDDVYTMRLVEYDKLQKQNFLLSSTECKVDLKQAMRGYFDSYPECDIEKILDAGGEGTGLTFVVFAEAITKMPGAFVFALLFYSMLLSLGFGSMVGDLEGCIGPIYDLKLFPWMKRYAVTGIVCLVSIVIGGALFLNQAGQYWLDLFDNYSVSFSLTTIALCEMLAISWVYGIDNFLEDIYEMCGERLGRFWRWTLAFAGPILMATVIIGSVITTFRGGFTYKRYVAALAQTNESESYPTYVIVFICVLICVGVLPIPLVALVRFFGVKKFELNVAEMNAALSSTVSTQQMLPARTAGAGHGGGVVRFADDDAAGGEDDDDDDELNLAAKAERKKRIGAAAAANRLATLDGANKSGLRAASPQGQTYRFGQTDRVHTESELSAQLPS